MKKLTVQGKVLVVVTECQYTVVFVVVEVLSYPIILGFAGFLVKYHAVIDSVKNRDGTTLKQDDCRPVDLILSSTFRLLQIVDCRLSTKHLKKRKKFF